MRSLIISRNMDILAGLRLAGIEGVYCKDVDELKQNFKKYKDDKSVGIIVLTEVDFDEMSDEVINVKLTRKLPLVVTIPGKDGLKDKNFILKYIKESIGIKIN